VLSVKPKKCKMCEKPFTPTRIGQIMCSPGCAIRATRLDPEKMLEIARKATKRQNAVIKRAGRIRLMKLSDWAKRTQKAFNHYICLRDSALPCISCGTLGNASIRHIGGAPWHAGHYRSIGSAPHLRFNETNVNKQCSQCNLQLSANLIEYRKGLTNKIGLLAVEALEADQTPKHYTIDDLKALEAKYKGLAKGMAQL
jgi:hypothetical protein